MNSAHDAAVTPRRRSRFRSGAGSAWWAVSRNVVSLAGAAALLVWGLPRVAGVGWIVILEPLTRVDPDRLVLFVVMQLCALLAFSFTITGSLPGISHIRGLTVSLAGSLVANTVPFGGALAIGATYTMCRSWGFARAAIGISIALGGVFSTAGKVLLPLLGLTALVLQGAAISPRLRDAAAIGVATLVAILALSVTMMISSRALHAVGGQVEGIVRALLRIIRRPQQLGWQAKISGWRAQTLTVLHDGWMPMTFGTLGYFVLNYVLFWVSMRSFDPTIGGGAMLAAFALGRLLTSVAVTPGGIGVVEAGSVALLIALGADPSAAASGVLLFTIFTHILEIPFGVLAWLVWLRSRRRALRRAAMGEDAQDAQGARVPRTAAAGSD